MIKIAFINRGILKEDDLNNHIIVPLNAIAMRDVLLRKTNYIKIEDFIDYGFAKTIKETLWQTFQALLDKADDIVSKVYDNYKIKSYGPFNLYAMGIRQMFDTMVLNYIGLSNIISKKKPGGINLLIKETKDINAEITVDKYINNFYQIILKHIAQKRNINMVIHSISSKYNQVNEKTWSRNVLSQAIKELIKSNRLYYYWKREIHEKNVNKINEKALFLQYDWGVYYYSQFFTHVVNDTKIKGYVNNNKTHKNYLDIPCAEIIGKLKGEIDGLSNLIGLDVKFIVEETLKPYIKRVPQIISRAFRSEDSLNKLNPRFVFFTNLHGNMLPFIMALCWNNEIIKVMKQHGDTMYDVTVWRNNELKPVNLYFTEFKEIAEYWKTNAEVANIKCRCECDGIRVNKYYRKTKTKNKLVYVPGFFDPRLSFDMERMPQPLFFRIQKRILQVLNQQKDFDDVVYKCLPGQHDFHYPVPQYINSHFKNIRISHKPLIHELKDTMYCLLDAPLSSMWEAINMNVPCQALVWNKYHLRPTAAEHYDKFLTYYNSDIDVSEKLQSILELKRFHTIDPNERKNMKRRPDDITTIFINELSDCKVL
jgi:hypothetical protein